MATIMTVKSFIVQPLDAGSQLAEISMILKFECIANLGKLFSIEPI
jgi:hypothetical protein